VKLANCKRIRFLIPLALCAACLGGGSALLAQEDEQVTVDDAKRTFEVYLPRNYDAKQQYPVVVLFSGRQQDGEDMARLTRFNEVANEHGIITVYPDPSHGRWNIGVTPESKHEDRGFGGPRDGMGGGYPGGMGRHGGGAGRYPGGGQGGPPESRPREPSGPPADDLAFVNAMLDKIISLYPVDSTRIYATGLSDGGFMDFYLGCHMAERLAAIAPVGAAMPKSLSCIPARTLPVLMINGTSDPVVPYKGGSGSSGSYATLSAEESARNWAKLNNCEAKPQRSTLAPREEKGKKTDVESYPCAPGVEVALYSVKDGGNTWPGSPQYVPESEAGKTSKDLDANEAIWKFFSAHALPAKPASPKPPQDMPLQP
jgi:polyhydroxybutyrate depolymerase